MTVFGALESTTGRFYWHIAPRGLRIHLNDFIKKMQEERGNAVSIRSFRFEETCLFGALNGTSANNYI